MKFRKMDNVYKEWIFLFLSMVICSCGMTLFLFQQMKIRDFEKIKKSDYYLKNGYVKNTILEKKTENQDKRLKIKLKDGETIYLVEKEREFPEYPKIPNKIKDDKKIAYLINDNNIVLSLKVDRKEYLPISEVQRCEFMNQLMWIILIGASIAAGIFFIYMIFYIIKMQRNHNLKQPKLDVNQSQKLFF